jgi:hypothetical protein
VALGSLRRRRGHRDRRTGGAPLRRTLVWLLLAVLVGVGGCAALERAGERWWDARRDSSGQAPDPATTPEPVIQIYAARTVGWRGVFGVHTWIALKRAEATRYRRYEVVGWGVDRGLPAVRVDRAGPDNYWFGSRPELLVDARGGVVEALIDRVEAAIARYPYPETYRTWPGPNSNTFVAWIGREVPELRLHMPPTAIGKDYLPNGLPVGLSPGGRGGQVSLLGMAGIMAGWDEGVELNVLGLTFGLDVLRPALKLPVAGRVGLSSPPERARR